MKRAVVAGVAALLGFGVGAISVVQTRTQLEVMEACDAAGEGNPGRALVLTEERTGTSSTGRAAAECRCTALISLGDSPACVDLMDPLLGPEPDWSPRPDLAALVVRARRDTGRFDEALALARVAGATHPDDAALFTLELELRAAREPEAQVLGELAARVPERGEGAARMRVSLAQRQLMRGDAPGALRALGPALPEGVTESAGLWYDTLGIAHAMNDDLDAARQAYDRWRADGGRPREVRARYALALSISGLIDPDLSLLAALRGALDDGLAMGETRLAETVAVRLLYTLVASGQARAALSVYDEITPRLPLPGVDRAELERALAADALAGGDPKRRPSGRIRFELAPGAPAGTLLVSPRPGAEPDANYVARQIGPGAPVVVQRRLDAAPQRWVFRSGERTLASGTIYPRAGSGVDVRVEPATESSRRSSAPRPSGAPADGRRRVAMLLLDCGDWPIVQYLRTRGDLPVLDALLDEGYRAVLDSDPPLTAAALEALVWPERHGDASVLGNLHRFGVELAGLESVGTNPVGWLSWLLPESGDLFSTIGASGRRAANLLLAHGGVRAGRHGLVHGPGGRQTRLEVGRSRRPLGPEERDLFPELADLEDPMDTHYVETLAAEFDASAELLKAGEIDLLAVRIEPLDILTHAHFGDAASEGVDHGRGLLFETYRYVDARIGELRRHLDGDDVLIVFSDHGIETAMEHSRPALFVAAGSGIAHGRAPGRPALRGVSRVVADLLGVETDWPDTGVAPWATRLARARR